MPYLLIILLAVPLLLASCSLAPNPQVPEQIAGIEDALTEHDPPAMREQVEWWKAFDDPVLNRLVETALGSNFDLEEAVARVDQARARARIARAVRLPAMQAAVGPSEVRMPTSAGLGAQLDQLGLGSDVFEAFGFALPDRLDLTTYTVGAEFAYEADFWFRDRNVARSARAESLAAESDLHAARIGAVAGTVGTYFEVVDLRHQRRLAGQIVQLLKEWKWLMETRYDGGLVEAQDVYAARRQLGDAEAELPQLDALLANAESRLWVLVGGYREELEEVLPDVLATAASLGSGSAQVPADLLNQRPDVRAARQRVEAARYSLGARRAELLPSLSLSGSIGLQSSESADWFDPDQWFRNLSANLLAPVLQRGRLRGNVEVAEATLDEAVARFGRSVLTAVHEVESAIAGLSASRRRVEILTALEEAAQAEADLRHDRYASGLDDYGIFLAASQMSLGAKSARAAGERELGYARLALHRAVGGDWTSAPVPPSPVRVAP
ncbi:MAG: efflux transporter outer membrane subunit [Gammaproteobacteria bacterium]|nr:efflux transporter outer membrane subunit [Gammaproteobacteria bacterium]